MKTGDKNINTSPAIVCDMIAGQAYKAKISDSAKKVMNRKPYYLLYEQERRQNEQTLQ